MAETSLDLGKFSLPEEIHCGSHGVREGLRLQHAFVNTASLGVARSIWAIGKRHRGVSRCLKIQRSPGRPI